MTTYLLDCQCGNRLPVEIGQAGGRIACSCGNQLDVPTLRSLRQLPTAVVEEKAPSIPWNKRKGAIAACLIVATILAAVAVWNRINQPSLPKFDPADRMQQVERELKNITPADAYALSHNYRMLAERGMAVYEPANRAAIQQHISHQTFQRRIYWITAAIFAAAAAVIAFWPRPQPIQRG